MLQPAKITEPGDNSYTVKAGVSVAERISKLTGIHERTVRRHLASESKGPTISGEVDTLSAFECVDFGVPDRYGVTSANRQAGRFIARRLVSNHDRQPAQY